MYYVMVSGGERMSLVLGSSVTEVKNRCLRKIGQVWSKVNEI